ncbi:MAG: hypothetical protein ABIE68_01985 [bacterium]
MADNRANLILWYLDAFPSSFKQQCYVTYPVTRRTILFGKPCRSGKVYLLTNDSSTKEKRKQIGRLVRGEIPSIVFSVENGGLVELEIYTKKRPSKKNKK